MGKDVFANSLGHLDRAFRIRLTGARHYEVPLRVQTVLNQLFSQAEGKGLRLRLRLSAALRRMMGAPKVNRLQVVPAPSRHA